MNPPACCLDCVIASGITIVFCFCLIKSCEQEIELPEPDDAPPTMVVVDMTRV